MTATKIFNEPQTTYAEQLKELINKQTAVDSHRMYLAFARKHGEEEAKKKRRELLSLYLKQEYKAMYNAICEICKELETFTFLMYEPTKELCFKFANRFIRDRGYI